MMETKKVLSGGQLAGGNSTSKREENDFYATDPQTLKMFLYEFWKDNSFEGTEILEPACGEGHISNTLKGLLPNFNITSTDLIDRGYGIGGIDFLTHDYKRTFDVVITNPPFSLAKEFKPIEKKYLIPSDEEIKSILFKLNKFSKEDEINCGACGYKTCKEKAIAIYNGFADPEFCLPYLKNKAESISNEIISHTPNGIVTVNKKGIIIDINDRACHYLQLDKSMIGKFYQEHLVLPELMDCIENNVNMSSVTVYNDRNDMYFDVSITIVKEHDYAFAIYKDVTQETLTEEKMKKLRSEMIEVTNKVINKQMRAVQEIASLLGESTAEAKIALVNFKDSLKDE